jgi:hypothetical protein
MIVFRVRLWGVTLTDERRFHVGRASVAMLVARQTCLMVGREVARLPDWSITVVWTRPFLTDDLSGIIVERTHDLQLDPFRYPPPRRKCVKVF